MAREGVEPPDASLFRAKINSDYNDFVARVALQVVDSVWWKQQRRVKSAGSERPALSSNRQFIAGHSSPSRGFCAKLFPQLSLPAWRRLDALEAAGGLRCGGKNLSTLQTAALLDGDGGCRCG